MLPRPAPPPTKQHDNRSPHKVKMSLAQLSRLLPLPDSELQQVLEYASSLSKNEAAEHFSNLLGDSPQVIEFISSFNSRRSDPTTKAQAATPAQSQTQTYASSSAARGNDGDAVPRPQRGQKKKKPPLHTPAPRQVATFDLHPGMVYSKKDQEDDYMPSRSGTATPSHQNDGPSKPPPQQPAQPKAQHKSAGTLVSDLLPVPKSKSRPNSNPSSRSSTPGPGPQGPGTKISIAGGTPMHGASTALTDLEQAIRSLELTTNPKHASNTPEGIAALICVKEGLGPCTFCGTPLLSPSEVQSMIRELKQERGREKQAADREAHRRPDVASTPKPFTAPRTGMSEAEIKAREHRDRLLNFQAQNAQRTTVRDEAADFDVGGGGSMWASPEERARELKRQQKLLREIEWNARPDYEKRRQVVSIDLVGKKVVRKMAAVERPPSPTAEELEEEGVLKEADAHRGTSGGGAFSRNPLLGGVIRPVYDAKGKGAELEGRKDRKTRWRRVQDDLEDNEAVILDGGIYGGGTEMPEMNAADEPGRG
ncbi:hypothetical protein DL546_004425 [Coniochaeta pulveracea]|uniref:TRIP4/RQT4 C2HC5-type zinc finger domain-containing protein n=1 Tax=Coniochaeta pulveracea TaxID=177199 RepID=A0A420Y3D2_9PEZI|nr:hypothetical protein DL546_004425 [Coniochaeta pulveracea]